MKKCHSIEKIWYYEKITMVLYRKLCNFDLWREKHGRLPNNYETLIGNGKNYDNLPKQLKFLNKYIALEL